MALPSLSTASREALRVRCPSAAWFTYSSMPSMVLGPHRCFGCGGATGLQLNFSTIPHGAIPWSGRILGRPALPSTPPPHRPGMSWHGQGLVPGLYVQGSVRYSGHCSRSSDPQSQGRASLHYSQPSTQCIMVAPGLPSHRSGLQCARCCTLLGTLR